MLREITIEAKIFNIIFLKSQKQFDLCIYDGGRAMVTAFTKEPCSAIPE